MLLAMAERRLGVAERLARCLSGRDPARITHTLADIRARIFAIGCGYGRVGFATGGFSTGGLAGALGMG